MNVAARAKPGLAFVGEPGCGAGRWLATGRGGRDTAYRPVSSEMSADSLTTAVPVHAALATEGVAVYIQNGLVAPANDLRQEGLFNLVADDFSVGTTYHILHQYSRNVEPGWIRVAAESDTGDVLAFAWVAPTALVVVLTNPGVATRSVHIEPGWDSPTATHVVRTVLGVSNAPLISDRSPPTAS